MSVITQEQAMSVLIVDDDRHMRESLRELLLTYDIKCSLAEDGQQALELLADNHFDLALLDIEMPKINGLQLMKEIFDHYSDTDIIVLSGEASFENARQAMRMGAHDFLNKPCSPSELIGLIHKIAEKKPLKTKNTGKIVTTSALSNVDKTLLELEALIHNEDLTFANEIINSSPAVAFLWKNISIWPVQFVSENVLNLLGYTANEFMTGKVVYTDLIHAEDLERVIREITNDNTLTQFKHKPYRMIKKSGTTIWVDDSTSIVRDERGNISHYQGIIIDVTEREVASREMHQIHLSLQHIAHHDPLTGLPNRLLLFDRMQQSIKKAQRVKKQLAILYIDLDDFKPINDTLGHAAGDEVLKIVAKRLLNNIRAVDTVARIGGDEFVVLMECVSDIQDVESMAKKLNQSLKESIHWENHEVFITSSIGISLSPDDALDVEELMKKSDIAMYQSKKKGRNNYQFYSA